jgi:rod shape-determining protein MreB
VKGRELMSGLPKTVVLTPVEIRQAIEEPVTVIVESVLTCLSQAPPELAQDLLAQGICLVGGGSLLRGLDVRLAEEAGVPVIHVDTPMECVVNGAGQCIESFDAMRAMFMDSRR